MTAAAGTTGSSVVGFHKALAVDENELVSQPKENYDPKTWLVVGDGDLSYSACIAKDLEDANTRLVATVLEEEDVHNRVYDGSKRHAETISSHPSHSVRFGIDATKLQSSFPDTFFDGIEFNFPHWRGKTNAKYNRQLVNSFLESAIMVLKPDGEIRVSLCHGQGGLPADSLEEWRQSWLPAMYAADHGLLLRRLEPYKPEYDLSSHRGVDRSFFIGDSPQRYVFTFPDDNPIDQDLQISCRHELRVMLHLDLLEESPVSRDDIVHGDAVLELAQKIIPKGIKIEIPSRDVLNPTDLKGGHVPLAVFLLNYSGERAPLTRDFANEIRATIEATIKEEWKLEIAKEGRLVSKPYPRQLLPKLIREYNRR
jgi:hypothetical protein